MNDKVEYRVYDSSLGWAETHVYATLEFRRPHTILNLGVANGLAHSLASLLEAEVRFNWEGSLQGHYVSP